MKAIYINPEIKQIKEKHYEMDWETILGIAFAVMIALFLNYMLPDSLGSFKPVIAIIPIFPIVLLSVKEFYGLKSYRLVKYLFRCLINDRPLIYESEEWIKMNRYVIHSKKEWKKVNENVRSRKKKFS